jgi:hypothetical protein
VRVKSFIADTLFLNEHAALAEFATLVAATPVADGDASRFVVICERKEDLLGVRAVLARRVREARAGGALLAGVTMFTLDSFAETLMKALALSPSTGEGGLLDDDVRTAFRKPFLDVVTQEKLLRVLLLRLRFPATDALSTAKQILTLVDVEFPQDENLYDLLLETQRIEKGTREKERKLTEAAFKQILCAYQGARSLLPAFSRLQRLVYDYLDTPAFRSHVADLASQATGGVTRLQFPPKALRSHLLWFAAPEYGDPDARPQGYRPGNFQASVVDLFRDALFHARAKLSGEGDLTLHARCYLSTAQGDATPLSHVEARVVAPRRHLWEEASARVARADSSELVLLADFPLDEERVFCPRASGPHPLHEEVLERFARGEDSFARGELAVDSPEAWAAVTRTLEGHWEELCEAVSLLDLFAGDLRETARKYGLSYVGGGDQEFLELWKSHCLGESVRVGEPHPLSLLPRALSYVAAARLPERIVALGPPHAPRSPSFVVKILNDAMAALARKDVAIELPATDESYRGFYLWLARLGVPLQFWIGGLDEFEGFPDHLSHKRGVRVTSETVAPTWRGDGALARIVTGRGMAGQEGLRDSSWMERLHRAESSGGVASKTLSMTQFERYVDCPMRFYLLDVLRIDQEREDFTTAPPRETGTAVHRVAELFVSLYKRVGEEEPDVPRRNARRVRYLASLRERVSDPRFLVEAPREDWCDVIASLTVAHGGDGLGTIARAVADDIACVLFDPGYEGPSRLRRLLAEETVKRTFLRLVITEKARLEADPDLQPGGFPEFRTGVSLGGLQLTGRVDRVDFSPLGYHIIDYKTSKVRKQEGRLVLFPSDAPNDRSRLTVQGALYALAWARDHDEHPVASFTLYRLKNLDEDTDVFLGADFEGRVVQKNGPLYSRLEEVYGRLAERLADGEFQATPRTASVCATCAGFHVCPRPRAKEATAP